LLPLRHRRIRQEGADQAARAHPDAPRQPGGARAPARPLRPGVRHRRGAPRMIPPLTRLLQARWPELRPGRPPVAAAIVAGLDRSPAGKVTLVFFDQAGDLAAVAKVARSPASEPALVREHETVSHLWALGVPSVRERVA